VNILVLADERIRTGSYYLVSSQHQKHEAAIKNEYQNFDQHENKEQHLLLL
jgi:hypothetical protein